MKLIKQLYFQLGIIILIYLLYLIALGNNIATTYFVVLLLCTGYIIANKQQYEWTNWIRIIFYFVLIYYLYDFFILLSASLHVNKLFQPDITNLQLIKAVYFDFFWSLLLIGVITFVLVFNKPVSGNFWFKKLISVSSLGENPSPSGDPFKMI